MYSRPMVPATAATVCGRLTPKSAVDKIYQQKAEDNFSGSIEQVNNSNGDGEGCDGDDGVSDVNDDGNTSEHCSESSDHNTVD